MPFLRDLTLFFNNNNLNMKNVQCHNIIHDSIIGKNHNFEKNIGLELSTFLPLINSEWIELMNRG